MTLCDGMERVHLVPRCWHFPENMQQKTTEQKAKALTKPTHIHSIPWNKTHSVWTRLCHSFIPAIVWRPAHFSSNPFYNHLLPLSTHLVSLVRLPPFQHARLPRLSSERTRCNPNPLDGTEGNSPHRCEHSGKCMVAFRFRCQRDESSPTQPQHTGDHWHCNWRFPTQHCYQEGRTLVCAPERPVRAGPKCERCHRRYTRPWRKQHNIICFPVTLTGNSYFSETMLLQIRSSESSDISTGDIPHRLNTRKPNIANT